MTKLLRQSSRLGICLALPALVAMPAFRSAAQTAPADTSGMPARVVMNSTQDRQNMMDQLGMKSIRPGSNGTNPNATNFANYDESKANPYPTLPEVLTLKNGQKVTTPEMWWNQRRPEIVEDFDREVYGRFPAGLDKLKVTWELVSTTQGVASGSNGDIPTITKQLVGHVDNSSYPAITVDIGLTLTLPANAAGPSPVMMVFGGGGPGGPRGGRRGGAPGGAPGAPGGFGGGGPAGQMAPVAPDTATAGTNVAPRRGGRGGGGRGGGFGGGIDWHYVVLSKGWGYAGINPASIQQDNGGGLTAGIIGLMNKGQPRKPEDWGSLKAWAWGAGRALDYFATDPAVDAKQVGIEGHSRYGKATIVTMAYDQRFAIAYVSSSGEGGAKLSRRNWGEPIENVTATSEYHWMGGNFLKYAGPLGWNDLPVDSHELVAMCAPRPTFLSAGHETYNDDGWVDAKGTFMAGAAAGPVYKLLGKKDMGTDVFPPMKTPLIDGDIAFRQHEGPHTDALNWETFLKFADRYIKGPGLKPMAANDTAK